MSRKRSRRVLLNSTEYEPDLESNCPPQEYNHPIHLTICIVKLMEDESAIDLQEKLILHKYLLLYDKFSTVGKTRKIAIATYYKLYERSLLFYEDLYKQNSSRFTRFFSEEGCEIDDEYLLSFVFDNQAKVYMGLRVPNSSLPKFKSSTKVKPKVSFKLINCPSIDPSLASQFSSELSVDAGINESLQNIPKAPDLIQGCPSKKNRIESDFNNQNDLQPVHTDPQATEVDLKETLSLQKKPDQFTARELRKAEEHKTDETLTGDNYKFNKCPESTYLTDIRIEGNTPESEKSNEILLSTKAFDTQGKLNGAECTGVGEGGISIPNDIYFSEEYVEDTKVSCSKNIKESTTDNALKSTDNMSINEAGNEELRRENDDIELERVLESSTYDGSTDTSLDEGLTNDEDIMVHDSVNDIKSSFLESHEMLTTINVVGEKCTLSSKCENEISSHSIRKELIVVVNDDINYVAPEPKDGILLPQPANDAEPTDITMFPQPANGAEPTESTMFHQPANDAEPTESTTFHQPANDTKPTENTMLPLSDNSAISKEANLSEETNVGLGPAVFGANLFQRGVDSDSTSCESSPLPENKSPEKNTSDQLVPQVKIDIIPSEDIASNLAQQGFSYRHSDLSEPFTTLSFLPDPALYMSSSNDEDFDSFALRQNLIDEEGSTNSSIASSPIFRDASPLNTNPPEVEIKTEKVDTVDYVTEELSYTPKIESSSYSSSSDLSDSSSDEESDSEPELNPIKKLLDSPSTVEPRSSILSQDRLAAIKQPVSRSSSLRPNLNRSQSIKDRSSSRTSASNSQKLTLLRTNSLTLLNFESPSEESDTNNDSSADNENGTDSDSDFTSDSNNKKYRSKPDEPSLLMGLYED